MKLIIDIDEETYENCKAWANVATVFSEETKSIANGIPYEERPQGDLISRSALKRAIEQGEGFSWDSHGKDDLCVRKKYIYNAPTVTPTFGMFRSMLCETCQAYATNRAIAKLADEYTRPQGEWIFEKAGYDCTDGYICSECGVSFHTKVPYFSEFNFCPNCGAQMIGGENHD